MKKWGLSPYVLGIEFLKQQNMSRKWTNASKFALKWEDPYVIEEAYNNSYFRIAEIAL